MLINGHHVYMTRINGIVSYHLRSQTKPHNQRLAANAIIQT